MYGDTVMIRQATCGDQLLPEVRARLLTDLAIAVAAHELAAVLIVLRRRLTRRQYRTARVDIARRRAMR